MKRHSRELVWMMAKTDFKLRHHGSVLGYLWTLLKPLLLFAVLWLVFSVFMRWEMEFYQLYLLLGILLWDFFAIGTMAGVKALTSKANLIKKIAFPRILTVIAATLTAFLSLFFNLIVFFIFAIASGLELSWYALLLLPLLALLYLFILGLALLLSALYIPLRDVDQIWEVLLSVGFWLTPIIYPLTMVPEPYLTWLGYNPMTGMIQSARTVLIDGVLPVGGELLYIGAWTLGVFVIGYLFFRRLSPYVAEEL